MRIEDREHARRHHPLWELTAVRFKEFVREPEALFWTFGFPVLLAIGLGIAFRNRPADVVRVGVVSDGAGAPAVVSALERGQGLAVDVLSPDSAEAALRTGRIALLVVPRRAGQVEYEYDDTRPDARTARLLADDAIQRGAGRRDVVSAQERKVSERGARYIDFVVPGLLGMNIMGGGIWGLGYAIVDARRKNLLKRLVATPMSRWHYLLSFMVSRIALLIGEVVVLLGFAVAFFGVPMRGSMALLGLICVLSALSFGGLGLLIAARPRTIEGVSGWMNLVQLPMWVLSGVFFSSANFPRTFQPFIKALPLTATNDALRDTMLRGAGLGAVAPEMGVLVAWMAVCFVVALRIFRWK